MKKNLLLFVFVGLIIVQIILPSLVANDLEKNLKEEVDSYENIDIDVTSFPALELLLTSADKIKVQGRDIKIDELNIASLKAAFKNLKLKRIKDNWQVVRGENTWLNLKLDEVDINDYLRTRPQLDIFQKIKLDITSQQVIINGIINLFNAEIRLQLTGDFIVSKSEEIVFNSDKLAVENILIPTQSIKQLKDKLQFKLDLNQFPLPLAVSDVILQEEQLKIVGPNIKNN